MLRLEYIRVDPYFGFRLIDNKSTAAKNRDFDLRVYEILYRKNYKCLTPYTGSKNLMTVICSNGHQWSAYPNKVTIPCNNCKQCWDLRMISPTERIDEIITSRGGKKLSFYIGSEIKMSILCDDNHTFNISPSDIMRGRWCVKCAGNDVDESKKKFYGIINFKGGRALTEYTNSITKVDIECKRKHIFSQVPSSTNMGYWCSSCACNNSQEAERRFLQKIHEKEGTLLSDYINRYTKVNIQCHNLHVFASTPSDINKGNWCPKCNNKCPEQAKERFIQTVTENGGKVLGEYMNVHTKVKILCGKDHIFEMTPGKISQLQWCPKCRNRCPIQARERFETVVQNKKGAILGQYINTYTKIEVRCEKFHKFSIKPNNATNDRWCRICGLHESHGERKIREYLTEMEIQHDPEAIFNWMPRKRYDFYFLYNGRHYIVEYDGIQHFEHIDFFSPSEDHFNQRRSIDVDKTVAALNQGFFLIRISYNNINEIRDIIDDIINDPNPQSRLSFSDNEMYDCLLNDVRTKLST